MAVYYSEIPSIAYKLSSSRNIMQPFSYISQSMVNQQGILCRKAECQMCKSRTMNWNAALRNISV